ncbi:MAG TPA: response regulator [Anaerolineae bacterium]|nr:response regulator [Anaerolineae bacterium]HXV99722.1 response regulator [Anaerolineae bacterium]
MIDKSVVLIVDDEVMIRDTLEGLLIQGYNLAFASNGLEALAKAAELTPDLILLDVMMPDMDGFEICQRLRADQLLAQVPIIMITALDDRESRLRGIKAGADDFVTKPFDFVELQARVQTITRLNRYRRLLMERNKFEWVVEQDDDGYLMLSDCDQILYANPQARLYLGLPADSHKPIAEPFLEFIRRQYHCEPEAAWATWPALPVVQSPRYLVQPESSTANDFWLQVDLMEMSSRSNERYLIRLRDVTPNVRAQNLMWTFHSQIGHKLKTPLTKITGFLSILKEDYSTLSDPDKNSILAIMDRSASQLQEEIMTIFQYLEVLNTAKPAQSGCSLAEISAVIVEIKAGLELKSIDVSYENLDNPANIFVAASCQIMELALWELLENAKKFHPKQSPGLEIKISRAFADIRIQISDDGLTLSPEQLTKMWVPYYQGEKYFTGQAPGMGLGLSMVASLIWSMGGTCRAYNREDGPGIVVELVLPMDKRSEMPK